MSTIFVDESGASAVGKADARTHTDVYSDLITRLSTCGKANQFSEQHQH